MKHLLSTLFALGVVALCEKPKPNPFAGKINFIKANNLLCGSIDSIEEQNGYLILNKVTLDKHKIGEIFSGGFIVIPAQRVGMTLELEINGSKETLTNVWIEEMTPYQELQETVVINQMAVVIENTDERPEGEE